MSSSFHFAEGEASIICEPVQSQGLNLGEIEATRISAEMGRGDTELNFKSRTASESALRAEVEH